jgi:hypothetical protein
LHLVQAEEAAEVKLLSETAFKKTLAEGRLPPGQVACMPNLPHACCT